MIRGGTRAGYELRAVARLTEQHLAVEAAAQCLAERVVITARHGKWWVTPHRESAMWWYNRAFMTIGPAIPKPLEVRCGDDSNDRAMTYCWCVARGNHVSGVCRLVSSPAELCDGHLGSLFETWRAPTVAVITSSEKFHRVMREDSNQVAMGKGGYGFAGGRTGLCSSHPKAIRRTRRT